MKKNIYAYDANTWTQIQYHNEKIYHNFEFFIKITLAISAGLAYLAINNTAGNSELISNIVKLGGVLEIFSGLIASIGISLHVKSRINRYEFPPENIFLAMWGWLEPYLIISILIISLTIGWFAWFEISVLLIGK